MSGRKTGRTGDDNEDWRAFDKRRGRLDTVQSDNTSCSKNIIQSDNTTSCSENIGQDKEDKLPAEPDIQSDNTTSCSKNMEQGKDDKEDKLPMRLDIQSDNTTSCSKNMEQGKDDKEDKLPMRLDTHSDNTTSCSKNIGHSEDTEERAKAFCVAMKDILHNKKFQHLDWTTTKTMITDFVMRDLRDQGLQLTLAENEWTRTLDENGNEWF